MTPKKRNFRIQIARISANRFAKCCVTFDEFVKAIVSVCVSISTRIFSRFFLFRGAEAKLVARIRAKGRSFSVECCNTLSSKRVSGLIFTTDANALITLFKFRKSTRNQVLRFLAVGVRCSKILCELVVRLN